MQRNMERGTIVHTHNTIGTHTNRHRIHSNTPDTHRKTYTGTPTQRHTHSDTWRQRQAQMGEPRNAHEGRHKHKHGG